MDPVSFSCTIPSTVKSGDKTMSATITRAGTLDQVLRTSSLYRSRTSGVIGRANVSACRRETPGCVRDA